MRRALGTVSALLVSGVVSGWPGVAGQAPAQPGRPTRPTVPASDAEIQVMPVQGHVYMLAGPGGNTTVQVGDQGIVVVDSQTRSAGEKLFAAIRTLSPKPVHYIINTHVHDDHTGGTEMLAKLGPSRPNAVAAQAGLGGNTGATTSVIAHENVLTRMAAPKDAKASLAWPSETYFTDRTEIFFNSEAIQVFHAPAAHTDGDSIVFFRRSDVIATGDVFLTTTYPVIDAERGGSVNGIINALNLIIELAVPDHRVQEGGTLIVPGHGRLCDEQDVIEYRDMVTIVRDRVQYMIKKGMTLDQVKAAKPTLDFDARYGADTGPWTTAMFIETVYRSLRAPAPKKQ